MRKFEKLSLQESDAPLQSNFPILPSTNIDLLVHTHTQTQQQFYKLHIVYSTLIKKTKNNDLWKQFFQGK